MENLLNSTGWMFWTLVSLALATILIVYLTPKIKRLREYAKNVQTCGYLPPPPNKWGLFWLDVFSWLILFVQVGRVKVIGRENLEKLDGKGHLITPNHPHFADVCVMPYVLGERRARYMAARGVFTFGKGLGALLFGPMGAFAVDLTKGKGGPAKDVSVELVAARDRLVIFPEGWAYLDGITRDFKNGAVRINREASEILDGEEVYLLPTYLRYGKYPGEWILKIGPPAEYFLLMLLFPFYRRGVTVVFGEPIPTSALPDDEDEATEYLKQAVLALDPKLQDLEKN